MNQPSPIELIITSLEKLSNDLHHKIDKQMMQIQTELQQYIDQAIKEQMTTLCQCLLTKLSTHIDQQIEQKTSSLNQKIEACLNELKTTDQQQLETLKLAREEFQSLQEKTQQALTKLQSISAIDDSGIDSMLSKLKDSMQEVTNSVESLQTAMEKLEKSISDESKELFSIHHISGVLTQTQTTLQQTQESFENYLAKLKPLVG